MVSVKFFTWKLCPPLDWPQFFFGKGSTIYSLNKFLAVCWSVLVFSFLWNCFACFHSSITWPKCLHADWCKEVLFTVIILITTEHVQWGLLLSSWFQSSFSLIENHLRRKCCYSEVRCCPQDTVKFPWPFVHIKKKNIHWLKNVTLQITLRKTCCPSDCQYHNLLTAESVMEEWLDELNEVQFTYHFTDRLYTMYRFRNNGYLFKKEKQIFDSVERAFRFNQHFKGKRQKSNVVEKKVLRNQLKIQIPPASKNTNLKRKEHNSKVAETHLIHQ